MIYRISIKIVEYFEKQELTSPTDRDIYLYGLDAALYTFFSTLGLCIIGSLASRIYETILFISLFYINQTLGGGFHASTHLRCFITMSFGLLIFIILLALPYSMPLHTLGGISALAVLWRYPLVLHPRKQYLRHHRAAFIRRSRSALFIQALLMISSILWGQVIFSQSICIALIFCALSRIIAFFHSPTRIPPSSKKSI